MLRSMIVGLAISSTAAAAAAQSVPGSPSSQPLQPGPPQTQTQSSVDPNAVPLAPPTFAPGVGAADEASPSAQHKVIRISGGVMAGLLLTRVDPVFPEEARTAKANGSVTMLVRIGEDGHVRNISVLSGPPLLRRPYMDAVKQWTYRPYQVNGEPVSVETIVTMSAQLNEAQGAAAEKH